MGMSAKWVRALFVLVYLVIGIIIAWDHQYITLNWLRSFVSAVLAVVFWWLVPLGVNLHIHA
jgi:hypothetical protein